MSNANLHRAKKRKNDEFYTRFEDVEKELAHYPHAFEGKVVYCNCDDPFKSAFVKYFRLNFDRLKLKRLIATCFNGDAGKGETMSLFPRTDDRVAWHFEKTADGETCEKLQYNGDFRSEECVALLRQCDVVVTNPPFSLLASHLCLCLREGVDFLTLGHSTLCNRKGVFFAIASNKVRCEGYDARRFDGDGDLPPVPTCWASTLRSDRKIEPMKLTATFDRYAFPELDNYDAIAVDKVENIPCDFDDVMAVPLSFLEKYDPSQFEIVGATSTCREYANDLVFLGGATTKAVLGGQELFPRLLIRRKNFSCNCSNSLINSTQTERKNTSKEKPTNQPKKNPEELDLNYDEPQH